MSSSKTQNPKLGHDRLRRALFLPGWCWIVGAVLSVAFAFHAWSEPMDFRVYHYGARGVFEGTRPVYGETSGMGWPMHYRYPPLFLLLFAPFAWLPLGLGAAVWVILKMALLLFLIRAFVCCSHLQNPRKAGIHTWLVPLLLAGPYVVEELRYGNAQFFVFSLTAAALWVARTRPRSAAFSLALGAALKVWPLFFLPYLAARRDWNVVAWTLAFVAILTMAPAMYFGFDGNLDLLGEWFSQESQTQLKAGEIWFPNQSLRGVLMRYFSVIDYSAVPDSNYPQIHIAAIEPAAIRTIWLVLAATIYSIFLAVVRQRADGAGEIDHGLAFCLLALLQPFTQKYALLVLLWPALVAGRLIDLPVPRMLIYASTVLVLVQPLVPGAAAQRLLQVMGADFAATVLLAAALAYPIVEMRSGRIL